MDAYEKKYKEALERARKLYEQGTITESLSHVFPELKESEDEKIKEAIISGMTALKEQGRETFATININDCIAWLERQSEQKPQGKSALEAVNEERVDNANEIETKFKVGEWIACEELNTAKIISIDGDRYEVEFIDGSKGFPHIDYVDRYFHRWTIRDAKGGDVLVTHSGIVFIFKNMMEGGTIGLHVAMSTANFASNSKIHIPDDNEQLGDQELFPATKEQRELLFQKMKDAGCTFDFEKKALKKIEQKSATMSLDEAIEHCKEKSCGNNACALEHKQLEKWLTGLKELKEHKPAWSEEDEWMLREAIEAVIETNYAEGRKERCIDWLKSLKERYTWKPSEEQIIALRQVISGCSYDIEPLVELETKLKEL